MMQEKIGNVTLDLFWYSGKDEYTDGPVEDELLEIARNTREENLNRVIAQKKDWSVMYHFSEIRQNIISWLPIGKYDHVLEIGAGCGAITGALCSMAGSVTSIDLSKKRSMINAYRNRDYSNLRIIVGNFLDIEPNLTENYDYITLIGVFEYAEAYMGSHKPYRKMLECVLRHLAPGGKLILAIENKLGMKYFAGCTEDHVGEQFVGIEGYPDPAGVRTFSRKELKDMLLGTGYQDPAFYYPYPDYKFPTTLYSDQYLPMPGEIRESFLNYDRQRILLFSEPLAYDSVIEAGLYPEFANSFLVIAGKPGLKAPEEHIRKPVYTKFSNERSRTLAVRTDIFEEDGKRSVRKTALFPEGKRHIERMVKLQEILNRQYREAGFACNKCRWEGDALWLEYVDALTLEEVIDDLLEDHRAEEGRGLLLKFLRKIKDIHSTEDFTVTPEFTKIFGEVSLPEGLKCAPVTNIDLICSNLMMTEPRTVLDYEWTFDFPVPGKYVLYRNLHYLGEFGVGRLDLNMRDLCSRLGIDDVLIAAFRKMEASFQKFVVEGYVPMRTLYEDISPGIAKYYVEAPDIFQIYFNYGEGYKPENALSARVTGGKVSIAADIPRGCTDVRIDPCSSPCMVSVLRLAIDGNEVPIQTVKTPGCYFKGRRAYFTTDDPAFPGILIPEGASRLEIRMNFVKIDKKTAERLIQLEMENDRQLKMEDKRVLQLMMENEGLKAQIREIKNTSVWKMYEMVKKK